MAGAHQEAGERRGVIPTFVRWFEDRTGAVAFVRDFFNESIPGSAGWPQVFGSVALFLLLIQAFTGILLALNYAPTPGDAYYSLQYIVEKVAGGRMIRGLHHWGASAMVVVVLLHMVQVFLYGAYKKPREVTWMVGIVLFVITLTFGLTGYLLPWDNRAYWGTVVTTQIAGQAPVFGSYIQRLLGGEAGVGVVTFSRFYALHTLVLPALAALLVGLHLVLVRRHGIAPAPVESKPKRRFYPAQAFKDSCAMFAAFLILFLLAATVEVPLERMADPTDITVIPRPEWYFLFLFQMLKFFPGRAEWIGSVVLPTVALAVLCSVPFLDRSRWQRVAQRTVAIGVVVLAVLGWASLTVAAVVTTPHPHKDRQATEMASRLPPEATPEELTGLGLFRSAHCSNCHSLLDGAPKPGPTLVMSARLKPADEMAQHYREPDSGAPDNQLSDAQCGALSAFLRRLTPDNAGAFDAVPPEMVAAAQIFVSRGCGSCHSVDGDGGTVGPPLDGLSERRTREWVAQRLANPKSQTPGTVMPSFSFAPHDRDILISYLFSLPSR